MHALGVATVEDAERLVQASQLSHIKVGLSDVDGVMLGKYLRRDKFLGALRSGLAFCDVVFGWDLDDQLYDNTKYTVGTRPIRMPSSGSSRKAAAGCRWSRDRAAKTCCCSWRNSKATRAHLSAAVVAPDAGPGRGHGL